MTTFSNYLRICLATFGLLGVFNSVSAQTYFSEDFNNVVGFPAGWTRANQDGRTPNANVSFINNAWIATALSATDSAAISTSYYDPTGMADDWMFTPAITLPMGSNPRLRWAARSLNNIFRDGYQVYIQTTAPTTSGNPVVGATLLLTIAAEDTAWQARTINLGAGYAGQTVYISFRNNSNDMVALLVDDVLVENAPATPTNDNCASATTLTPSATCTPTAGTTASATASGLAVQTCNSFIGSAEDDVWYQFVATATNHNVTVAGGASFDAVIEVYGGTCAAPTFIGCADGTVAGGSETATLTGLTIGTTYRVRVFDYEPTASAAPTFTICVTTAAAAPANDNCANATTLTPNTACVPTTGTTAGATTSGLAVQACFGATGSAEDDVWYQFVATSTSHFINVTGAASFDAVVEVYGGTCAAPTFLNCADQVGVAGTEFVAVSGLTVGNTYRIRVFDYEPTASTTPTFTICVTTPCPLTTPIGAILETEACSDSSNNGCQRAIPQYGNISCGQTVAGTVFANNGTRDFDYYRFTLAAADSVHITANSEFPVIVQIVSIPTVGGCASISLASASGAGIQVESCVTGSTSAFIAAAGTYYIRVFPITFFGLPCGAGPNDYNLSFRVGAAMSSTTTSTNAVCAAANGSATSATTGGRAPYTFAWSNSTANQNLSNVAAGTYTLTVTDANLCRVTTTTTVGTTNTPLNTTISNTPVVCATLGTASLTAPTGGTAPYAFNWGGGVTSQNRINLAAATYNVTVTDANGCSTTRSTTVASTPNTINTTISNTPVICATLGSANLTTPNGGTAPYAFNWGGGVTSQNRINLAAATYNVTVTDANGCSTTRSTTVASTPNTINTTISNTPVICLTQGTASLTTPTGGTTPYTFNWGGGITIQNRTNLAAGTYNVTVTDGNGCTTTRSTTVASAPNTISSTISNTPAGCSSLGSANLTTPTGGNAPYTFNWGGGVTSQNRTNLAVGTYNVTITDANGCFTTNSTNVGSTAITVTGSSSTTATTCGVSSGRATVNATNGIAPYSFVWSNGSIQQTATALGAGTYNVTITDANGCSGVVSNITVANPAAPSLSVSGFTNVSCNGGNNGAITVAASGGTPSYNYAWSNGAVGASATGLTAGAYTVTVTDAASCAFTLSQAINQPAILSLSAFANNISCNGANNGSINTTVTGGTPNYTYLWSNGATSPNLSALMPNAYSVTVTDANGCVTSTSRTITQPANALTVATSATNIVCNGGNTGAITTTVSGGTTPYSFAWSNGETSQNLSALAAAAYSLTVTDANGCTANSSRTISQPANPLTVATSATNIGCNGNNTGAIVSAVSGGTTPYSFAWTNGATSQNLSTLAAGSYSLTVTDANGCTANTSNAITQPANPLTVNSSATNIACNGNNNGAIVSAVSGGTTPYSFAWSNGATSQNLLALAAGTYSLTVTDANSCTANTSVTITAPANALAVATSATNITCNGSNNGAVSATVSGGTTPYSFAWSNGATSQNIAALSAGVYGLTVTDANSCVSTSINTITEPAVLTAVATGTTISCANNISLAVNGGTTPYSILWSNADTIQDLNNVLAGTYTVTVTDANNCQTTSSATVTGTGAPSLSVVATVETAPAAADGTASLTVTGTGPFTFAWSNGATTQNLSGLVGGVYTVTVSNATCSATISVTVSTAVNIENLSNAWALNIFPNPANDIATLSLELPQTANSVQVQLVDIAGRVISSQEYSQTANVQQQFDAKALTAGVYFVRINADGVRATRKLIISGQ